MPHARPTESFVWRAAARPERARLLGAIAIAVSCGGLGVVAGRWSATFAPAEPATRTAVLIQDVAKEMGAKTAAPGRAPADAAAAAPVVGPSDGQAASVPAAPSQDPVRGEDTSEPALAAVSPADDARPARAQAKAPGALPNGRRSQQAATVEERPTSPNYQALRNYVLGR
jgi:hypothetical protein